MSSQQPSLLEQFIPVYHFREFHVIDIRASPARVFRAIKELTPREISLTRPLFFIRSIPARLQGKRGLGAFENQPLLEQVLKTSFILLGEEPNVEIVLGTVGQFWRAAGGAPVPRAAPGDFVGFDQPGYAKAAINFHLTARAENKTRLTTETRIVATDAAARKKFAGYWRLIYPGSAFIRMVWLRAIKKRAQGAMLPTNHLTTQLSNRLRHP